MATANFYINAEDGWVLVASNTAFLRVSAVPRRHSFLITDTASGAPAVNSTRATGTITISSTGPVDGETVTIDGQVYTFKDTPVAATDVAIDASIDTTASNLATKVNANSAVVTASVATATVTLTAVDVGTGGNTTTLTEAATNVAVSGATLTGAVDKAPYILVNELDGPFFVDQPIAGEVYARVIDSQPDKAVRLDVFSTPGA